MNQKLSIRDLDLKDKKVLIRVDFNVPLKNGQITNDARIRASLPTIQYVLDQGGSAILMSHLGRPKAQFEAQFSLAPCAERLAQLLNLPVKMAPNCRGEEVERMAKELRQGDVLLLENLRFHKGEEKPDEDPSFVKDLARLGDVYIQDAFGSAHRLHASTALIAKFFPGKAAAGFLVEKEISYLGSKLMHPKRPFCAILGGAKISTKFKVIQSLMRKADVLLIGGAMAYTFFKAQNISIGQSLIEEDYLEVAKELMRESEQSRCRLLLPVDLVIASKVSFDADIRIVKIKEGIPSGFEGVDLGPETLDLYRKEIQSAATIFWNGPVGIFECSPFDHGTNEIAKMLADVTGHAITIVGGGDSVAALENAHLISSMSHVSTGGGATLEYIEFGQLPGIEVLETVSN